MATERAELQELVIDEEFKLLCPPLSTEERAGLQSSIEAEGCRDALIVWSGVIIDGHNRYRICRSLSIPFRVHERQFDSRDDAKRWMLLNQAGRRNLSSIQASYMRGKLYEMVRMSRDEWSTKPGSYSAATQDALARQFKVSNQTIKTDMDLAQAVDALIPAARDYVLNKDFTCRKSHVTDLAILDSDSQAEVMRHLKELRVWSLKEAILLLRPRVDQNARNATKCSQCNSKLAPGVETCLKCDLDCREVKKRLDSKWVDHHDQDEDDETQRDRQAIEDQIMPHDIESRIADARAAKQSGDEIWYHANWLCQSLQMDAPMTKRAQQKLTMLGNMIASKC